MSALDLGLDEGWSHAWRYHFFPLGVIVMVHKNGLAYTWNPAYVTADTPLPTTATDPTNAFSCSVVQGLVDAALAKWAESSDMVFP